MADKYQPDKFEAIKVGEKADTTVVLIEEGIQEDFRSEKYWEAILEKGETQESVNAVKTRQAIKVSTENGADMVLNLPENNIVNPASNFALWKKTYGDYPKQDQKVTTKTDESGFNRIVLEK